MAPLAFGLRICSIASGGNRTMDPKRNDTTMALEFIEKAQVREVLENYFQGLDTRDETRLAACFTEDALAIHHSGSDTEFSLSGGAHIAHYFSTLMPKFLATTHACCNLVVQLNGDMASASTFAIAHVVDGPRVRIRGLRYIDQLVRGSHAWRIQRRTHIQLWQCEADSVTPFLPR
jgi:hypothetical protein